jgi:L-Ala-D/L-Glu epimerase
MVQLKYYPIELPCEFDFTISRGTQKVARHVFVELTHDHEGKTYTGMGEAVPCEFYGDTQESIMDFLSWVQDEDLLAPLTPFDIQKYVDTMQRFPGYMPAKAAIEMALYDLMGQVAGQPIYKLLGLDPTRVPRSSYTIGLADIKEVKHKTQVALDRGYDILKVKVGGPKDLETLETIRKMVPDSVIIRVDANAAWLPDDAIKLFPKLVEFGVEFVEEPLQVDVPIEERRRVKEASPLPLIADESVHTLKDVPLVAQWMDGINLKLTKTGGLTEALRMIHAARAHNLSIMLGCFVETSVSITAFAHLAPLVDYLDLDGGLLLAEDPIEGVTWNANQLTLPDRPGLGVRKKAAKVSA